MTTTVDWAGTLTARSSIAHGGETRATFTLLRREWFLTPDGLRHVPVISGNALRGRLRRIAEELLRDTLNYEGELSLAAAHALRGGGALAKSGTELSGARLRTLRLLVPNVAIFGCAAGGRIIDGALQVGKLIPHVAETAHLTGVAGPPMLSATQLETYTRQDEGNTAGFAPLASTVPVGDDGLVDLEQLTAANDSGTSQMLFRVETFPAGTVFDSWIRLERATDLQVAFLQSVLDVFTRHSTIGGRAALGHGRVRADWIRTDYPATATPVDWRTELQQRRTEVMDALKLLT